MAERTRAILDSVLVGIVTVGAGGIEWMNRSARRMFGGELADFIGAADGDRGDAGAEPSVPPHRTTSTSCVEGQAETFECRVQARDGREFWVVGNAVATGRAATGRQLTYRAARHRAAPPGRGAHRRQAQASLQRVIEAAPMAITLLDARTLRHACRSTTWPRRACGARRDAAARQHAGGDLRRPTSPPQRRRDMEQALAARRA